MTSMTFHSFLLNQMNIAASKLIAYNDIMPTKIYDKIKMTGISMASGTATLTLKSLIE